MMDPAAQERLASVFASVLALDTFSLDLPVGMGDIEEWDSFAQINLMLAIEDEFGIEFDADQIGDLISVDKIVEAVATRIAA